MHGSSHHLLQKKFALVRYNAPHVQILLLLSAFRNNVIVTCNNLICNMCSPTWETHIPSSSKVECYTPQQKVESKIFFPALDTTTPKSNYEYI